MFRRQLFATEDNGRFSVLADGTLVVERVVSDDAGQYVCEARSAAGSAFAKAKLDVRGMKIRNICVGRGCGLDLIMGTHTLYHYL